MKKLILLALLLSACSSSNSTYPNEVPPYETPVQETGIQTRTYTSSSTALTYTMSFDASTVSESATSFANYHDFEINTGGYPAYLSVTSRKPDNTEQTPEDFLKIYYAPTQTIPTANTYDIQGMEAKLYVMPDFSSSYTEFALVPTGEEFIVFMFQCAGTDEASLAADRDVFVSMLSSLTVN